jgi:DegV family protein with EDD domain
MARTVALVTDSTAMLPKELTEQRDISVVPLQVVIGAQSYLEGVDAEATPDTIAGALRRWAPVSTSRPTPATFLEAYENARRRGAEEVLSIHLSGEMSGTFESAQLAALELEMPVHVVDSGQVCIATGYAALTACDVLDAGGTAEEAAEAALARGEAATSLFYVDTLEYLRRGGRIGAAQATFGTAFSIKPLLTVKDGEVSPLARVPGTRRALAKMVDLAVKKSGGFRVDIAVTRFGAGDHELEIGRQIERRVSGMAESMVVEASTVIGAHLGPGALGITVSPVY